MERAKKQERERVYKRRSISTNCSSSTFVLYEQQRKNPLTSFASFTMEFTPIPYTYRPTAPRIKKPSSCPRPLMNNKSKNVRFDDRALVPSRHSVEGSTADCDKYVSEAGGTLLIGV